MTSPFREASYLIAFGSAVLCIGSPLMSWSPQPRSQAGAGGGHAGDRHAHIASAFVTTFEPLLAIRLVMLLAAASSPRRPPVLPVSSRRRKRANTVAFVFIGWSFALALGVPLAPQSPVAMAGPRLLAIGAIGAVCFVFLVAALPARFMTPPVDLKAWAQLFRSPPILTLLAISGIFACGQYMVLTFIEPLLVLLGKTNADGISLAIAMFGIAGICRQHRRCAHCRPRRSFYDFADFRRFDRDRMAAWSIGAGIMLR